MEFDRRTHPCIVDTPIYCGHTHVLWSHVLRIHPCKYFTWAVLRIYVYYNDINIIIYYDIICAPEYIEHMHAEDLYISTCAYQLNFCCSNAGMQISVHCTHVAPVTSNQAPMQMLALPLYSSEYSLLQTSVSTYVYYLNSSYCMIPFRLDLNKYC